MGTDNKDSIKEMLKNLELFEKYVNESLKYKDNFKDITVGDWSENKEAQKNDHLIQIEVFFNEAILEIEKDPKNKLIGPNKLQELINIRIEQNVVFPLDKDKEIKVYINKKIIDYLSKLKNSIKSKRESNQNYTGLNFKEFVYLCFELGLVKEKLNRKLQEAEIREIYENNEHPIFDKIELLNPIKKETSILSQVKKYNSNDKDYKVVQKIKTTIKDLKLNNT